MSRRKSGIVNVRMVITEEKILSNIDKVQKLINPKSKKERITPFPLLLFFPYRHRLSLYDSLSLLYDHNEGK